MVNLNKYNAKLEVAKINSLETIIIDCAFRLAQKNFGLFGKKYFENLYKNTMCQMELETELLLRLTKPVYTMSDFKDFDTPELSQVRNKIASQIKHIQNGNN